MRFNLYIANSAMGITQVSALWPIPQQVSTGSKVLMIDGTVKVTYNGISVPWASIDASDQEGPGLQTRTSDTSSTLSSKDLVSRAVSRTFDAILNYGLYPWMLNHNLSTATSGSAKVKTLDITQTAKDASTRPVIGSINESYSLHLDTSGKATIEAASSTGVVHALETFTQLFFRQGPQKSHSSYTNMAPVSIFDYPRFPYRGLLLDVSRSWVPESDIKRTIDALAMSKMNVIHLHMTDTQSWPLEIPALPKLASKGSFAPGLTYSPETIRSIQEYGAERGVQVILEIDMPGHVGIDKAYPDLSVASNALPYSKYCSEPPCGSLRLNNTEVEQFLATLFDDLLPRLAQHTTYFHAGGDEYKAANSLLDPNLQTGNMTILKPMLQRFLNYSHELLRNHGFTRIMWDDLFSDWNMTIGKDTIIQSWHGTVQTLATAGYKVIDSTSDAYYLPCGRGVPVDFKDADLSKHYPFTDWCAPTKNWRVVYMHDPIQGLSEDAAKNVLGGEVAIWTETIDPVILDSLAWPRASAAGEAWWSGRTDSDGNARSVYTARPRLAEMRERMLARGIKGSPVTPLFCNQNNLEDCTG